MFTLTPAALYVSGMPCVSNRSHAGDSGGSDRRISQPFFSVRITVQCIAIELQRGQIRPFAQRLRDQCIHIRIEWREEAASSVKENGWSRS